ncbi:MAG TPA: type II secretion system protein [Caulobacteraceae bacterium]|jgi:general secretion pathway protein H
MAANGERAEGGFTLIESLVVLAIFGLVAALGFPRLQQVLATVSRREAVAAVAAELREVRADAVRADREKLFFVASDGHAYGGSGSGRVPTPAGVEVRSAGGAPIGFFGDGSATGGGVWVSAGGKSTLVRVAPMTGAISVGAL